MISSLLVEANISWMLDEGYVVGLYGAPYEMYNDEQRRRLWIDAEGG